jgi:hypothetical protein
MTLDEGDLFVVVRGRQFINAVGAGFGSMPLQTYDRSYDGYIFKAIKIVLDIAVVEVVYARKSLSLYAADETGTRQLMNLRDLEIMTVDAEFVAALTPLEKPKDTAAPAETQTGKPDWLKRLENLGWGDGTDNPAKTQTGKPDWLKRLENLGWGESPIAAAMKLAYKDKVAKANREAEQYQLSLLTKLEEASKLASKLAADNKNSSDDSETSRQ